MKTPAALQLLFQFDAQRLQTDLRQVKLDDWIKHYRQEHYEGNWAIAPLRSVAGHAKVIYAVPNPGQPDFYKNTSILENCPYFQAVLQSFQCPINAARLMSLEPGAEILEHSDDMGTDENVEMRIHIPVQTNSDVQFYMNGELVKMLPGEVWWGDFSLPHKVKNHGTESRIHLVLDCIPNGWLREELKKAGEVSQMIHFLQEIGIPTKFDKIEGQTFLPGLKIEQGTLVIDLEKLKYPGDILHEAGHIAVTSEELRPHLNGDIAKDDPNVQGQEIATILWSYAASVHLNLSPETVFHEFGYRGSSSWFIENFWHQKNYIGLPLLEWKGLALSAEKAKELGMQPFPKMMKWV